MAMAVEHEQETQRLALTLPSARPGLVVSPEAFWDLCIANPSLRLSRTADGELIAMSPAGSETSARNLDLAAQLWVWNQATGLGVAFESSAGFTLDDGFTHAPDAAWVSKDRWAALEPSKRRRFAPICPDFVVELMSPSDSRSETRSRLRSFIEHGARLGWLLDPDRREVEVHRPGQPVELLSDPKSLSGEDVLPGFTLDLTGILPGHPGDTPPATD